jgi:kynurenine formamidase
MTTETSISLDTYRGIFEQVSNWGRWGPDDELGALNFITPDKRRQAAGLVRDGGTVGVSSYVPTTFTAPQVPTAATHLMTGTYDIQQGARLAHVEDYLAMAAHAHSFTHIDALCHMAFEGKLYNGKAADAVVTSRGARSMGMEAFKDGLVSRGVLLDIPRARGVEWVEPGDGVELADLARAEQMAGLTVESGDVVLVRTGRFRRTEVQGAWNTREAMPGLRVSTLPWIHDHEVAVFGCDSTSEIYPPPMDWIRIPMHVGIMVAMGIPLMDNVYMEELSRACAERGRWEFMFVIAPLKLKGGTGLAVNPIAIF